MDCSLPGSSVHGIFQARILEWVAISFSRIKRFSLTGLPWYSSASKESACNAGDPGSIPGLGRSPGEGVVYPLQYSWPALVVQSVKNQPAKCKTWVLSLGWEDPWEEGILTQPPHYCSLLWEQSMIFYLF